MKTRIPRAAPVLRAAILSLVSLIILCALPVRGQGTIAYSGPLGQWLMVDVDGDGTAEFPFDVSPVNHIPGMSGEVYSIRTVSGSSIAIEGMLYGESLHLLNFGAPIGASLPSGDWSSRDLLLPVLFVLRPTAPPYDYVTTGPLAEAGSPAFIGMRMQMADGVHYGWAQLSIEQTDRPRAFLVDWAYETRPEFPIAAGVVPEPSVSALLIAGGALLAYTLRNRKYPKGCIAAERAF
jgi:hypothetical protein